LAVFLVLTLPTLSCAEKTPAAELRDQVLDRLERGGLLARAEQGSVTWSFGQGGPVRVGYDFETGGEPFIPFPLVVEGERLYLSGEMMDGADPQAWILLTPRIARGLWRDERASQEDKQLAQTILAFVRYGDPRRILSSMDMATARVEAGAGVTRLIGSATGETILGKEVPVQAREWLYGELAFPRVLQVVLEAGEQGLPLQMTAVGSADEEGRQAYSWSVGPQDVQVPDETGDFRDWLESR
jgi:hypothetical protein